MATAERREPLMAKTDEDVVITRGGPGVWMWMTIVAAVVVSAVLSRLLSLTLTSPWIAVVFVIGLTAAMSWWLSRHADRNFHVGHVVVTLVGCSVAAFVAWIPADQAVHEPELFAIVRSHAEESNAAGDRLLAQIGPGECTNTDGVDVGPLTDAGPWQDACATGPISRGGQARRLSIRSADARSLRLVYAGDEGPFEPNSCTRRIIDRWWAVRTAGTDPASPCPLGFAFSGSG
jgi:hypothetical protein